MPSDITVIKQNLQEQEVWRYSGRVIRQTSAAVLLEADFNREDTLFEGIPLKKGDPFIEAFYTRRWFNIFEMHDRDSGAIKGWYCNVTRPAVLTDTTLSAVDLALDLLVYPDGHWLLLDEDEYTDLKLNAVDQAQAQQALVELQRLFSLGADFELATIFPVTDPYEARLKMVIARNGWQVDHLTFDQSTHSVAEAAAVLGVSAQDLVKNICLITPDDRLLVAIVRGEDRVSPALVAEALGLDGKPRLATAEEILARTGYPMGGTPSFGFDALFVMDEHTFEKPVVYTGGGSPSALATANPYELLRANRGLTAAIRK
ncbi:MAG TPA: YbaK/EbsC family protein [Bellilinea sp.]|nr:YbaK/EbsC family protein [Bellilinea sp.]